MRLWNGNPPRGCYVVMFLIIYFTAFYIKCINTTALCKQWSDRLQWELQEVGKTGSLDKGHVIVACTCLFLVPPPHQTPSLLSVLLCQFICSQGP
jgi:hypothetical protein